MEFKISKIKRKLIKERLADIAHQCSLVDTDTDSANDLMEAVDYIWQISESLMTCDLEKEWKHWVS